jgi:lipopolysaccharide transport system permease protein
MAGVVEGFRGVLLGKGRLDWPTIMVSITVVVFLVITGTFYFRRMEKEFADVV